MKTFLFLFAICTIAPPLISQNWVQVGNLNNTPRAFLNDTISGLLFISGNFVKNGPDTLDGLCSFDGNDFVRLGHRNDCGNVSCNPALLLARYGNYIYFSGGSVRQIDSVNVNGIGRWDGAQWEPGMPGLGSDSDIPFLDNYCVHDGLFYGVGIFRTANGDTCNSVAYWDGQKWTGLMFLPYPDNTLSRVSSAIFFQNQLYVGGNFSWQISGGQDIARLTDHGWELVGGGLNGGLSSVFDMAVYKGELYICGYFASSAGNVGNKIMRWNGQQWKTVGDGFCSQGVTATAMMVYHDKLYVVGNFNCVQNDLSASEIATWDGTRWCNLGNAYFDNTIAVITAYKDEIYVGGGFTMVDGQPCRYLAKWVGDENNVDCSAPVSGAIAPPVGTLGCSPNPADNQLKITINKPLSNLQVFSSEGLNQTDGIRIVSSDSEEAVLNVSGLNQGWYIFVVTFQDGLRALGRFVKS